MTSAISGSAVSRLTVRGPTVTGKLCIDALTDAYWSRIQAMLLSGGSVTLVVGSGSMSPLFRVGDHLEIVGMVRDPVVGDTVLTCCARGQYLLHRLIIHRGPEFRTKGDALRSPDSWSLSSEIIGICVAINGHRIDTPTWRFVNRQIARLSPYSHQLRAPVRLLGRLRRALGLWWL